MARRSSGKPSARALALATSQWIEGEAALRLNHGDEAKPLLAEAFTTVNKLAPESGLEADILVSRARLESTTAQVQSALVDYLSAFQIYKRAGNSLHEAITLQDIGLLYHDAGDYERALANYAQSQATYSGTPTLDLSVENNRADSLGALGRYREAEAAYQQALAIADRLKSPSLQAQVLDNLAAAQINDHQYGAAAVSLRRGLKIARTPAASAMLPTLLATNAQLALKENRLEEARASIETVLRRPDPGSSSERDVWVHRTAYDVYKAEGATTQALAQLEAYQKIQDSHRMLMASANTALMAARFDFDNQNARISSLRAGQLRRDMALTQLRARQNQITLAAILAAVTSLSVFLALYLRTLRRSRDQTRDINMVLNETNTKLEQALQAKTQFLATTSHEIRTPLNGVLGMTEVLLADQKISSWVRQRVSLIHGAGEAMRILVDDLLDMSKMDAAQIVLQRDVVDLPTLLWEVHRFWITHAESAGLKLALDISRAPIMIVEDARRLRQILSNLLSNAVKFTPSGSIAMSVDTAMEADGETLIVRVVDSGIGVPEESQEMIFEKFTQIDGGVTRKYGGTGLGLSIARTLARSMGGDVFVRPAPAGGSVFTLTLPLVRMLTEDRARGGESEANLSLADMHVVMVEPNPITQGSLRSVLERRVESLTFVSTIKDAVDYTAAGAVHIVIAPVPKGGWSAAGEGEREMTALAAETGKSRARLVIIMDAGDPGDAVDVGTCRASRLERPVSAAKLIEHLESLGGVE